MSPFQRDRNGSIQEHKFSLSAKVAAEVRAWARAQMEADPHGGGPQGDEYAIHSLYLDTVNFDVLLRNGSFGRGKYRIRRYGADGQVFLERKMKARGFITKRRTLVALDEIERLADLQPDRRWAGFWYHRRVLARGLRPVCQVEYSRTARQAATESGRFRLTLDEGVTASAASGLSFVERGERRDLSENRVILEIKFPSRTPDLARRLISEFNLHAVPSSKYRFAGLALGFTAPVEVPEFA